MIIIDFLFDNSLLIAINCYDRKTDTFIKNKKCCTYHVSKEAYKKFKTDIDSFFKNDSDDGMEKFLNANAVKNKITCLESHLSKQGE